jgi:hypothetical protein
MNAIIPRRDEVALAVEAYNTIYGEMDEALWCLSRASQELLLRGQSGQVVRELVWKVRSWWGVQGVRTETADLAAQALARMPWSEALFTEDIGPTRNSASFAVDRVTGLVAQMKHLGVNRTEFSLSAKVLHWLMPWRIPVYDSFVKKSLGAMGSQESVYRDIAAWESHSAARLMAEGSDWVGTVNPRSPLRALDKYLWRKGGGDAGTAAVVKDPWEVCRRLGLIGS